MNDSNFKFCERVGDGTWIMNIPKDQLSTSIWSGKSPLPEIGDTVEINFNGFGKGKVVGYFTARGEIPQGGTEHRWYVGVEVHLEKEPEWYRKQNGNKHRHPQVFGSEINIMK